MVHEINAFEIESMTNNSKETVPTRFLKAVEKWGDRVAMRKKEYGLWNDISWNDYHDQVKLIACALMSMGLKKGDTAAIIGDNCPEWVYTDLSIQCCGAATTGVYATNAWQQVEYVVENSESRFFFVENEGPQLKEGHRLGYGRPAPIQRPHGHDL
jgi:long-chain acyl-CoA synthetase